MTEESVIDKVKERLSFFFSDANVRQDRFIRRLLLSEEGDHPHQVTVESLLRFNTIKQHTTKPEDVVEAALSMDELVVSDDKLAIGRAKPFTASMMDDNIPLTLCVGNLPNEDNKYTVGLDEVRDLFSEYGKVSMVKFRFQGTSRKRTPSGMAMVEFADQEGADKASADVLTSKEGKATESKRKLKLGDAELTVITLKDFIEGSKRNRDDKRQRSEDGGADGEDDEKKELEPFTIDWKKGCVIRIKGVAEGCSREAILSAVASGLGITVDEVKDKNVYADYSKGQKDGAIRFETPDSVEDMLKKLKSGDLEVAGAKVEEAFVLEGDEEEKYWQDFIDFKNKQRQHRFEERSSKRKKQRRN